MSKSRIYFYLQKLKVKNVDTKFLPESVYGEKKFLPLNNKHTLKTCVDCKFYIDKDVSDNSNDFYIYDNIGLCRYNKNGYKLDNIFASVIRLDDKLCGKKGKWFEKKKEN